MNMKGNGISRRKDKRRSLASQIIHCRQTVMSLPFRKRLREEFSLHSDGALCLDCHLPSNSHIVVHCRGPCTRSETSSNSSDTGRTNNMCTSCRCLNPGHHCTWYNIVDLRLSRNERRNSGGICRTNLNTSRWDLSKWFTCCGSGVNAHVFLSA